MVIYKNTHKKLWKISLKTNYKTHNQIMPPEYKLIQLKLLNTITDSHKTRTEVNLASCKTVSQLGSFKITKVKNLFQITLQLRSCLFNCRFY